MKKIYTIALCLAFTFFAGAQVEKYDKVKIFTNDSGLEKLATLGIAVDHGEYKKSNYFISEFSESDINLMRKNGFTVDVLISDMANFYVQRNKNLPKEEDMQIPGGCVHATPKNFRLGTMGGFYTLEDMLAILDTMRMKFPDLISVKKPASSLTTAEGRKLYFVRISNHPDSLQKNKPKVLYTGLHHAREPISLTELIMYMWYVMENYNKDADITNIVNNTELYFIPCINPDGYMYNETTNPNGGGFWRKNRRNNGDGSFGVDLNRNYGYQWGRNNSGSSPSTFSDTYRGPSAFSEPETQIVRDFCKKYNFKVAINNHSYSNVLVYPWGYAYNKLTKDSTTFTNYANTLTLCNGFHAGTANQTVGYLANGTSDDWMYGEQTLKEKTFAMTPETGSSNDGFWPAKNRIIPICKKNLDMHIEAAKFATLIASPYANTITATQNKSLTVFQNAPNPCNRFTVIRFSLPASENNAVLNIFNATGAKIKSIALHNTSSINLDVSDLKAGIYYYNISTAQRLSSMMKMVIVQ